ncbi:hypothetical protein AYK24_08785 [Thermoplasmatales archaeon SG8-52-4]|nr:MAG: hypothetical protein AYK24_08785 [Thermoplasmatales archaeon SG8-52-4]
MNLVTFVQQPFIRKKTNHLMTTMLIVGQVSSKEEANEITFIAKLFVVGQRARYLAKQNKD